MRSIACPPQFIHLCPGEILILRTQNFGHLDEVDSWLDAHRGKHSVYQVPPRTSYAGAAIEEPTGLSIVKEMQRYVHRIFDVDKVSLLFTIGNTGLVGLE
jgi:hypothetical protein